MSAELTALAVAILLQLGQYVLMSVPANLELGVAKTLSPRDRDHLGGTLEDQVSLRTARLLRALNNHFEALILFTAAVTIVELSETGSGLTAACAWSYVVARALYVPAYAFGWVPWRSLIWMVGLGATGLMLMVALLQAL